MSEYTDWLDKTKGNTGHINIHNLEIPPYLAYSIEGVGCYIQLKQGKIYEKTIGDEWNEYTNEAALINATNLSLSDHILSPELKSFALDQFGLNRGYVGDVYIDVNSLITQRLIDALAPYI